MTHVFCFSPQKSLNNWKANTLWSKLDKRAQQKVYEGGRACSGKKVVNFSSFFLSFYLLLLNKFLLIVHFTISKEKKSTALHSLVSTIHPQHTEKELYRLHEILFFSLFESNYFYEKKFSQKIPFLSYTNF